MRDSTEQDSRLSWEPNVGDRTSAVKFADDGIIDDDHEVSYPAEWASCTNFSVHKDLMLGLFLNKKI